MLCRWILKQLGDDLTEADIDDMIADVDTDGSGWVDFEGNHHHHHHHHCHYNHRNRRCCRLYYRPRWPGKVKQSAAFVCPSVCFSVRPFVSTLSFEPTDL